MHMMARSEAHGTPMIPVDFRQQGFLADFDRHLDRTVILTEF